MVETDDMPDLYGLVKVTGDTLMTGVKIALYKSAYGNDETMYFLYVSRPGFEKVTFIESKMLAELEYMKIVEDELC